MLVLVILAVAMAEMVPKERITLQRFYKEIFIREKSEKLILKGIPKTNENPSPNRSPSRPRTILDLPIQPINNYRHIHLPR